MEHFLLEKSTIKTAILPKDLDSAPNAGARVDLKDAKRVAIIVHVGASTGATLNISLEQHNAAVGGTSKALEIDNKYFKLVGAATKFEQVQPSVKASSFDLSTDFAANAGIVVLEVLPEDLDVNGGFSHISVNIADAGAAKLGSAIYQVKSLIAPAYDVEV